MIKKILLFNGNIYPLANGNQHFSAILLNGDKIEEIGDYFEPTPGWECIDLQGRTVLPGFSDCHVHFFQTGLKKMFVDCTGLDSIQAVQNRASELIHKYQFVPGWGYNPDMMSEKRALNIRDLDAVSVKIPIYIRRVDGHSSYLNSAARKLVEERLFGMGGTSHLDEGVLTAEAHEFVDEFFLQFTDTDTLHDAARIVEQEAFKKGVTSIHALTPFKVWTKCLLPLVDNLSINLVPFCRTWNIQEVVEMGLRRIGGCLLVDGSFGSRTAALLEPYNDDPANTGRLYFPDQKISNYMKEANAADLQFTLHAIGPRGIGQYLNCYEQSIDVSRGNPLKHRLEHCELPTPEQIEKIREMDIILSMQPAFEYYWGGPSGLYSRRLGERWRKTNPLKTLVDNDIIIIGGSDSYVTPIDPLLGIHAAVNHPNYTERLTVFQALKIFTSNPAYAAGEENKYGILQKGMQANLVVLNEDIFNIPQSSLKDIGIFATYVNGKFSYGKDFC